MTVVCPDHFEEVMKMETTLQRPEFESAEAFAEFVRTLSAQQQEQMLAFIQGAEFGRHLQSSEAAAPQED